MSGCQVLSVDSINPNIMKKILLFTLSIFILTSCTEIIFEEAQPVGVKAMNQFPNELQGKFGLVILNEESIVEIGKNSIKNEDGIAYLSDSLIVKKLGDRYVVNIKIAEGSEEKKGNWQTYVLEDRGCGFVKATSFIVSEDYIEDFTSQYENKTIGDQQNRSIIIKPTAAQFNTILADDSVTVSMILERLD